MKNRILSGNRGKNLVAALFFAALALSQLHATQAAALTAPNVGGLYPGVVDPTATFTLRNRSAIEAGTGLGIFFYDSNTADATYNYQYKDPKGCSSSLTYSKNQYTWTLKTSYYDTSLKSCLSPTTQSDPSLVKNFKDSDLILSNQLINGKYTGAIWEVLYRDGDSINSVLQNNNTTFKKTGKTYSGAEVFIEQGKTPSQCPALVIHKGNDWSLIAMAKSTDRAKTSTQYQYLMRDAFNGASSDCMLADTNATLALLARLGLPADYYGGTQRKNMASVSLGLPGSDLTGVALAGMSDVSAAGLAANGPTKGSSTAAPGAPVPEPSGSLDGCSSSFHEYALGWIVCPLINLGQTFTDKIDAALESFLTFDTSIFDTNAGQGYQDAWSAFRTLALAVVVIAGLVMVISQVAGLQIVDAYTVRKVLPRLLIAAIGITLSWVLLKFIITLFNDLGNWVGAIIQQPFQSSGRPLANTQNIIGQILGPVALVGGGLVGATTVFATLGGAGTLMLFVPAILALVMGIVTLLFRNMIITLAVLTAPLAIAMYVLPGTQKVWKFWQDNFVKALVMFPLVMAFLAVGKVLATVSTNGVMAAVSYFAPYFMIPYTFKMAGGIVGSVANLAQSSTRGLSQSSKKRRGEIRAERTRELNNGSLYQNRGLGKLINTAGVHIGAGTRGRFGFTQRGREAIALRAAQANEERIKSSPLIRQLALDDDANAVMALSGGSHAGAAAAAEDLFGTSPQGRERANRAISAAASIGFNRDNAGAALTTLAQNKSRSVGPGQFDIVQKGINRLSDNETERQQLAYGFQYNSRQSGRIDLGGNWTSDAAKQASTPEEARRITFMDGVKRTDTRALVSGHDNTTAMAHDVITSDFNSRDFNRIFESGALLTELAGNLASATGGNRNNIIKTLADVGIDVADPLDKGAIEQQIADRINSIAPSESKVTPEMLRTYSRTWGSSTPLADRARTPGSSPQPPRPGEGAGGI